MATASTTSSVFQVHGRSFLAFVVKPEQPIDAWMEEVDRWLGRSPTFFAGKPVVIDVFGLQLQKPDMAELVDTLKSRGIRVMGMVGAGPSLDDAELPPILSPGPKGVPDALPKTAKTPPRSERTAAPQSLLIDTPIRSGQSLFHQGDVTVIGSVSSGAEIVATGSIHIYGTLRGRVLAGADGNTNAHIFCRRTEAELIAIDGYYRMADEIAPLLGKPIHAWLQDGSLAVKALD
jgi:septum site-determining protein MinC